MTRRPVLLLLVLSAALVGCGPKDGATTHTLTVGEQHAALAGVPEQGFTLGRSTAPATLSIYAYVTAPAFAEFVNDRLPGIVRRYVRPGRLRLQLRTVASAINDDDVSSAQLLLSAGYQNELWPTLMAFSAGYAGGLNEALLAQVLRDAGIPQAVRGRVLSRRRDPHIAAAIDRATDGARRLRLRSAAAYVLQRPGRPPERLAFERLSSEIAGALR